ncbi:MULTISPECIES: hypothetical protein [Bifidobacterium]|uniref:DNA-binding protein n=2 Tax=Bifidobacterium TaxID=1678 RepID=A0A6L4WYY8_9BIFI|nr:MULTISPECIES: hypothetical protein [Bifidobacterium]KAB8287347.1 hypothetical protein DSM100688_1706 [Bifidobacterium ramosum]NEG55595.1 hypothetical protein [Bifidobacterium platyrrhinorum]NEG72385.1 hypothetical protein [Bifidobacterium ramosum]
MMRLIDGEPYISQSDMAALGECSDSTVAYLTSRGVFRESVKRASGRYWYRLADALSWRASYRQGR